MRALLTRLICIVALSLMPAVALADDWVALKLRGTVLVLVDGEWAKLERGAIVPDDRVVRTLGGRLTLTRGAETIELGPNTQIQIFDKAGRKPFTTVKEYFGTVAVEAEVKDVQHFAVQTPHLVAVVKGTRFVVSAGKTSSTVSVNRGAVAVEAKETRASVLLAVGQSAEVGLDQAIEVSGKGTLPVVLDAKGKPVTPGPATPGPSNAGGNSGQSSKGGNAGNASNAGGASASASNAGGNSGNASNAGGNSANAKGKSK